MIAAPWVWSAPTLRLLRGLPRPLHYLLTAALVALAVWLGALLRGPPFLFLFPTILIVAVAFDHRASAFATLLGGALAAWFLIAPQGAAYVGDIRQTIALIVFVASGLAIGVIVHAMRKAIDELSRANTAQLELWQDRAAQLRLTDAIMEGTPDAVYVKDRDGRFVMANSGAARVLGVPREAVPGTQDRDYLTAETAAIIEATDRQIMADGRTKTVEERVALPGGAMRTFFSSKFPWTDSSGEIIGLIGMSQDISRLKEQEERLKAADAQKQLLLYDINHRVKNHLQTVVGLMSVAAHRATTVEAGKAALADAASRLQVLARVYTRLQIGTEESVVDARGFIEELCSDLKAGLVGLNPITIKVDAERAPIEASRAVTLGLVINELVQNAIKYAFPAERAGEVRVEFRRTDGHYRLTIADDGVGLSPDEAAQGSGQGRRLIRAMAQQLGGTVAVESGPGTRFELRFPAEGDGATRV